VSERVWTGGLPSGATQTDRSVQSPPRAPIRSQIWVGNAVARTAHAFERASSLSYSGPKYRDTSRPIPTPAPLCPCARPRSLLLPFPVACATTTATHLIFPPTVAHLFASRVVVFGWMVVLGRAQPVRPFAKRPTAMDSSSDDEISSVVSSNNEFYYNIALSIPRTQNGR
jgi:hypothetical protein